jgi:hypothetical protein
VGGKIFYINREEYVIIGLLLFVIFIIYFRNISFLERTKGSYRVGNLIGFWYTEAVHGNSLEDPKSIAGADHDGTFAKFLVNSEPKQLTSEEKGKVLKKHWWWDDVEHYKDVYPEFNETLRHAIDEFKDWEFTDTIGPNTCVVHLRVGDFTNDSNRTMTVDEIVKATDKLPRVPEVFEILNGGKFHEDHLTSASDKIQKRSEGIIDELFNKIKSKFPNSKVVKIESENADHDFYRMVKAPMLLAGLGSFASMAAAANKNFRLTPGFSLRPGGRDNAKEYNIYEQWFTYV